MSQSFENVDIDDNIDDYYDDFLITVSQNNVQVSRIVERLLN